MKKTKIVASISDRRCSVEFIRSLFEAGANVIRMNTAHATREGIQEIVSNARQVSSRLGILIDTKGPEVRTTGNADEHTDYRQGDIVRIYGRPGEETERGHICVSYPRFVEDVSVGAHVLFDDGLLDMLVQEKEDDCLVCEVQNDGILGSHKSVNVPGVHIDLPALTEKDIRNLRLACELDIDFVAHSFVRSAADVKAVQAILDEEGSDIKIISKIENQEGVDNIDEIIAESYGIMIARGDLGIELPLEIIPGVQHAIIRKCVEARKPVIVATQMLHNMIKNPRPTRAEVNDIATAIFTHTDALMLSGETASGKYPVEAVQTMARIAEQAERDMKEAADVMVDHAEMEDTADFLSRAAIDSIEKLGVRVIMTDSKTGGTVRKLASYRGRIPVVAVCYTEKLQRWLALSYGVECKFQRDTLEHGVYYQRQIRKLVEQGILNGKNRVAYISGSFAEGGYTSLLQINRVEDVLANKMALRTPEKEIEAQRQGLVD